MFNDYIVYNICIIIIVIIVSVYIIIDNCVIKKFCINKCIIIDYKNEDLWSKTKTLWNLVKIKPFLFFIGEKLPKVLNNEKDIILINKIKDIPLKDHKKILYFLIPILFKNDMILTSLLNIFPNDINYFKNYYKYANEKQFISWFIKGDEYNYKNFNYYYNAGKGKIWSEIFQTNITISNINKKVKEIYEICKFLNQEPEYFFFRNLNEWNIKKGNFIILDNENTCYSRLNTKYEKIEEPELLMKLIEKKIYTDIKINKNISKDKKFLELIFFTVFENLSHN